MRKTLIALAFSVLTMGASSLPSPPPLPASRPVVDTFYGVKIADPYRYFEDMRLPEVQDFFKRENAYTRTVLAALEPARERLFKRIAQLDNAGVSVSGVQRVGNQYFYEKLMPGQNTEKLYVRQAAPGSHERLLVDPDAQVPFGAAKHYTIDYFLPSLDGAYVGYGISEGGSENAVIHIVETATGRILPDAIDRAKFVGLTSWRPDGVSFYYFRLPKLPPGAPNTAEEQKGIVYLHVLNRDPDKDTPILGYGVDPHVILDPSDFSMITLSPASPYALGVIEHGVKNEVTIYVAQASALALPRIPWRKIIDVDDEVTGFDLRGSTIYLLTHKDAPSFRILAMRLEHPDFAQAPTIVPASGAVVEQVAVANDGLYVLSREGGFGTIARFPTAIDGTVVMQPTHVKLPYAGSIASLAVDPRVDGAVFAMSSWTKSALYYHVDARGIIHNTKLKPPSPVDASAYGSHEVQARSADGTMIPLSLVYRSGLKLNSSHPTYLEGYGAYGIEIDPYFSTTRIAWLERDGVYAVCHVRGGGWFGEAWHRAGMIATKEHTIADFIACGRYLVENGYTSPAHLAGEGTSAGGILIGGAITRAPELFAAALDVVGVSDALRSEFSPNGPPNIPEFGSVTSASGFKALREMDAYQHVRAGTAYPAVMSVTGINDPRVPPWELAKFTARLQSASTSGRPVLLRVDYDGGHGFLAASRKQSEHLLTDEYSFLLWQLGDPAFQAVSRKRVGAP
jgi:prolyl oligopeptidase